MGKKRTNSPKTRPEVGKTEVPPRLAETDKKHAQVKKELDQSREVSRRAALKALGGVGLVAAAFGVAKLVSDGNDKKTTNPPHLPSPEKVQEGRRVTYPGMTILEDKKISFPQPAALKMEQQEFVTASQALGSPAENLINELEQNGGSKKDETMDHLKKVAALISRAHPKMKEEWQTFYETWDQRVETLFDHVNEYLKPGSHYLEVEEDEKKDFRLRLRTIADTKHILLRSPLGDYEVKVLDLKGGGGWQPDFGGHLGTIDHQHDLILMMTDRIEQFLKGMLSKLPPYPLFQKPFEFKDLLEKSYKEYLYHEAIHIFLSRQFPGISKDHSLFTRVIKNVGLKLKTSDGTVVDFTGDYSPQMVHELCAFGGQLMISETPIPIAHGIFLQDPEDFPPNHPYHFLYKVLPYSTMNHGPDSDIKTQLMAGFHKTKKVYGGDAIAFIGYPPFSVEHTRAIGRELYGLGFDGLRQLEQQYNESRSK